MGPILQFQRKINLYIFAVILVVFPTQFAVAMDAFEIQVYDGRINDVGQYSLETHVNDVVNGLTTVEYPGQTPNQNMAHLTFEFARGMTSYWEMGAYFQTALLPNGNYDFAGAKFRNKFVVPKDIAGDWHFGANFEIAYIPYLFEKYQWSGEIRPIIGYSHKSWTFLANPILGVPLTTNLNQTPSFEPAVKIMNEFLNHVGLGIEYYSDFGPLSTALASAQAEQYLFAVYDLLEGPVELNVGLGEGLNSASNSTVAKLIFGFDFN